MLATSKVHAQSGIIAFGSIYDRVSTDDYKGRGGRL